MNKQIIFSVIIFLAISTVGFEQSADFIPEDIITSIRKGNANKLASFFNSSIELVILERENVYSRSQAVMIMKDFFKKNPPLSFSIIHQGGKANAKYGIGLLRTRYQTYRVYLLIKPKGGKPFIHQLRIEKENGQP